MFWAIVLKMERKKENFELLDYPKEGTFNTHINTVALLHVLKTTVKYEFCNTPTSWWVP